MPAVSRTGGSLSVVELPPLVPPLASARFKHPPPPLHACATTWTIMNTFPAALSATHTPTRHHLRLKRRLTRAQRTQPARTISWRPPRRLMRGADAAHTHTHIHIGDTDDD
uniref:Uncharacterized protein n=1 Tax=Plectus sambesii TaxID=2011161 RepID=A0A914XPC7_9BILA